MTFIFYDTETTGLEPAFDQILQFAAIITDDDFNTIEEVNLRGRLRPHLIASPGAIGITNVGPRTIQSAPLSFYEMVSAKLRDDRTTATAPNQIWAMDFVHDQLFDGKKIRVLTIVDTFTRLSPAIDVRQDYRGCDVVETLERVSAELGYPKTIRVDNGPEFISKELDLWAFMKGVTLDFSRPGKPTDNAFIESLNGKFRAECLNANWFLNLDEARRKCEDWRRDYNEVRPHSGIGNKVPMDLHRAAASPASLSSREARIS